MIIAELQPDESWRNDMRRINYLGIILKLILDAAPYMAEVSMKSLAKAMKLVNDTRHEPFLEQTKRIANAWKIALQQWKPKANSE